MKKLFAILFVILLMTTGCSKTETGDNDSTTKTGEDTIAQQDITEDEIRQILDELLEKAQEIDSIIIFDEFEIDEDVKVEIENEYGGDVFNLVTDTRFSSIADLEKMAREVYSEKIYSKIHANILYNPWGNLVEQDGKLYASLFPVGDMGMVDWSLDEIELDYVLGEQVNFFATVKSGKDEYMGRISIIKEDGQWKFDSTVSIDPGVPYNPNMLMYMEPDIADREAILAVVKAQYPDENINDYYMEIESDLTSQRNELSLARDFYYAVNLYDMDNMLAKRLFVPLYDGYETIEPETSKHGVLRRDFTNNINEDGNELFAFVTGKDFEMPADFLDFAENFEEARVVEGYLSFAGSNGEDIMIIVPKYYGDLYILKDKDGNIMNGVMNESFILSPSMNGEIIVRHMGKDYTIKPTSDPNADLPKGIRIDFEYPEALG